MRAGLLNHRVRIERPVVARDLEFNSEVKTWAEVATVWANVQDVLPTRAESVQHQVNIAERPSRVRMRYRSDITPDMRVVILGLEERVAEIVAGPAEIGRREGTEILVKRYSA